MAGFDDLASPPTPAKAIAPVATPPTVPDKPAAPGFVEKLIGGIGSGVKEAVRENKALDAQTMKLSPPELKLPPKPEFQNTSPMDAWGSIAMVFAALASTKVRNHASTAMNAAAAAMKGIHQQDKDAYDRAFKEWETSTKNAIDLANFQQHAYDEMLHHYDKEKQLNLEAGKALDAADEAKLKTLTVALQDPGMWQAYEKNGIAGAVEFQKLREKQTQDFELRRLSMMAAGQKAAQTFALRDAVASPEFKAAKTTSEKLEVLAAHGVDSEHILIALAKLDQTADIAADKASTAAKAQAEKEREFNATYGLKERAAKEKADEFGVKTDLKKSEDAFKALAHADQMKAKEKELAEKAREADEKLAQVKEKLKVETETKHAALEERAKEAFDKIALGKDVLAERAINDNAKLNMQKYKLGETHEEFEQRMTLEKDKAKLTEKKDEERKAEFREKMDLELKKFDEKKAVDAERIGVAKEKLASAEKAGGAKALTPEEIEETAQEMAHLKIPMATDYLAARNPSWGAANRRAMEIAKAEGKPDFSAQWYPTLLAQRKDAGSGQASKGIRYLSVANKHLEAMEAAVMSLPNDTDLKGVTRVFNFISNQVNDSNLAAEQVDGQIVANEVAKAISGAGNLTGEERDKLNSMFDAARGKASILSIIHHARELLGGQAGGYVKQFSHYGNAADVTGMDPDAAKSFFINPKTGDTDPALVQWDRARISAVLEGKPPPPMPGAAQPAGAAPAGEGWKFERAGEYNGKPVGAKDGKWVYEDGTPVEGQ